MESGGNPPARKVMVVADPTRESAAALQYALSHAVLDQDELILVHVMNPNSWKNTFQSFLRLSSSSGSYGPPSSSSMEGVNIPGENVNFLEQMKRICEMAQPKMRVRVERMETESSKAAAILLRSGTLGVDVIIIGQRRTFASALLGSRLPGGSRGARGVDTAEYLIENSKCTCVAVQKKGSEWRLSSQY